MTDPALPAPGDIRPLVGKNHGNRAVWIFAGVALAVALGLFTALEARRAAIVSPATTVPQDLFSGMIAPPPPLAIPQDTPAAYPSALQLPPLADTSVQSVQARPNATRPVFGERSPAMPTYSGPMAQPAATSLPAAHPGPAYVFQSVGAAPKVGQGTDANPAQERVKASRLANPSSTVPQGTVIQAVLESALDSSRPGFARAIVTRDISSFDGTRVLVPRGSKLFGEYKSDLERGQRRALIQWRRLTRPDGTIIDVDSPTSDPLGRAGVTGRVNTHFFERFGGAILQSALDIGVQVAARRTAGDTVVLALPNSAQNLAGVVKPEDIKPTVKVRQGTSVSVLVVRDLDFSDVES